MDAAAQPGSRKALQAGRAELLLLHGRHWSKPRCRFLLCCFCKFSGCVQEGGAGSAVSRGAGWVLTKHAMCDAAGRSRALQPVLSTQESKQRVQQQRADSCTKDQAITEVGFLLNRVTGSSSPWTYLKHLVKALHAAAASPALLAFQAHFFGSKAARSGSSPLADPTVGILEPFQAPELSGIFPSPYLCPHPGAGLGMLLGHEGSWGGLLGQPLVPHPLGCQNLFSHSVFSAQPHPRGCPG